MSRQLSRARVSRARGRRSRLAVAAMAASGVLTGVMAAAPAHAALTINLQFAGGGTTMLVGGDQTNTSIGVQVWATVTGTNTITPTPVAGASGTAPTTTGGDFDGLQYLYYNILNSNSTGTEIAGGVSSVALNSTLGFNANGSQLGTIQNVSNGISVGSNTSIGSIPKPRSASAVFDNFATYNQSAPSASAYQEYGNDGTNIKVSGNSVSFLVETVNFKPSAYSSLNKTTFSVSVPSAAFIALNSIYAPANWFEDTTTQKDPTTGQPMPLTGNKDASPVAGTSVVIEDTINGDANLDGVVNFSDLSTVLTHYGLTDTKFTDGNFNYGKNGDTTIDFSDLSVVLTAYGLSVGTVTPSVVSVDRQLLADPQAVAALEADGLTPVAAVPEPASVAGVVLCSVGVLSRRRRRA